MKTKQYIPYGATTLFMCVVMTGMVLANRPPIYIMPNVVPHLPEIVGHTDMDNHGFVSDVTYCVWGGSWNNVKFESDITNGIVMSLSKIHYDVFPPLNAESKIHVSDQIGYQCYDTESFIKIPEELPVGYYRFTTKITMNNALYGKTVIHTEPIRFLHEDKDMIVPVVEKTYKQEFRKSLPQTTRSLSRPPEVVKNKRK